MSIQVFRLNAKLAWIIQELPAFVIPVLLLLEARSSINVAQLVISGMFLIHYFNRYVLDLSKEGVLINLSNHCSKYLILRFNIFRSFIFPMHIREGSSVPFLTCLMAFIFCCFNGFFQAHNIIYSSHYTISDLSSPNFILGRY